MFEPAFRALKTHGLHKNPLAVVLLSETNGREEDLDAAVGKAIVVAKKNVAFLGSEAAHDPLVIAMIAREEYWRAGSDTERPEPLRDVLVNPIGPWTSNPVASPDGTRSAIYTSEAEVVAAYEAGHINDATMKAARAVFQQAKVEDPILASPEDAPAPAEEPKAEVSPEKPARRKRGGEAS